MGWEGVYGGVWDGEGVYDMGVYEIGRGYTSSVWDGKGRGFTV